jgi:hypothetical protein
MYLQRKTKIFGQDIQSPGQDSNKVPIKYAEVLTTTLHCFVKHMVSIYLHGMAMKLAE